MKHTGLLYTACPAVCPDPVSRTIVRPVGSARNLFAVDGAYLCGRQERPACAGIVAEKGATNLVRLPVFDWPRRRPQHARANQRLPGLACVPPHAYFASNDASTTQRRVCLRIARALAHPTPRKNQRPIWTLTRRFLQDPPLSGISALQSANPSRSNREAARRIPAAP